MSANVVSVPKPKSGTDRSRAARERKRERDYLDKPFIGWDGEGVTLDDGSHIYTLLANSKGDSITAKGGLHTGMILQWLWDNANPDDINVIYGAGYDWNMWLKDLPRSHAQALYDDKVLWIGKFRVTWHQGRMFTIRERGAKKSVTFYDVLPFFQRSFVAACDEYLGDNFIERDMIVYNKGRRSTFEGSDADDVKKYNDAELTNLVNLMIEFRQRLFDAGLPMLSKWYGPGALAAAVMKEQGIRDHIAEPPVHALGAIQHAYFGGRFEVIKTGHTDNAVYEYDINSAYPWGLLDLPSLAEGEWIYHDSDPGDCGTLTVYHVIYNDPTRSARPQPLPARDGKTGNVAFPNHAEGWYWSPEVSVLRDYVERYGGSFTVVGAWEFVAATESKPFGFVQEYYDRRQVMKAAGDGANVGLKLALNSLYLWENRATSRMENRWSHRRDYQAAIPLPRLRRVPYE